MISPFKQIWFCVFGPRLYKIHGDGPMNKLYSANGYEHWGDQIIQSLNIMWKITIYASPFVAIYMYRKDYMDMRTLPTVAKFLTGLSFVIIASYCIRSYGRLTNSKYREFAKVLVGALNDPKINCFTSLRKFDFDFEAWPIDYNAKSIEDTKKFNLSDAWNTQVKSWKDIPLYVMGEIATRTFALKLIYPGSISLLQMTISKFLLEGRIKLVEAHNGLRYKIHTRDDNDIDCMFVDKRNISSNGNTLVITAEGNAGFYEIGIMTTPIEAGYSVLGWNHPGFGGSSGNPYPFQEHNAVNAVLQFALNKLKFTPENIVLFGWSIGCYSIAWAASQYPDVKGIVLDATFDDILPLAKVKMPASWSPLVTQIIRGHVNLNNAEMLKGYNGPIKLIRRTLDEIICTEDGNLGTNRGNNLVIKVLSNRYPYLFEEDQFQLLRNYLSLQGPALAVFKSKEHPGDPDKNKKVLFLVEKYLTDYQSTHCTPLPSELFHIPQEITLDEDFVFT